MNSSNFPDKNKLIYFKSQSMNTLIPINMSMDVSKNLAISSRSVASKVACLSMSTHKYEGGLEGVKIGLVED